MPDAVIDVLLNEPIATINPNIYGHFMEHLGGCVEGGCWVGEDSPIPNTGGVRNDVVAALKAARAPVIRWPGGCFADDYHWQDGIGPRDQRPRRINIHWGDVIETNHFGTHEFLAFCKRVGAEPYLCGNVGSGSPRELRDWVEYCNFPGDSTLARERAANGSPEPFGIRYWGVGNENWGCGGYFTPDDYATEYRRFAAYLRNWGEIPLYLIACGPCGNDLDWTRRFFTKFMKEGFRPKMHAFAAHYYCGTAGTATEYTEAQWYELLWKALQMEPLVVQQRALMDAFDPERNIGLIVDEWGTWHPPTPGHNPAFLWQQNTVRDALVAALTLDIFNRHADKVVMANIAQTINVLQALLLTEGDKMIKTPTYHVYDLYAAHQGKESLRTRVYAPDLECVVNGQTQKLPMLSVSASKSALRSTVAAEQSGSNVLTEENLSMENLLRALSVTVTIVNTHAMEAVPVTLRLHGTGGPVGDHRPWKRLQMAVASLAYPSGDIHSHNTFESPETVTVREEAEPREVIDGEVSYSLPPASVTRLTFTPSSS